MYTWYQATIRFRDYEQTPVKDIKEAHLLQCISFTDAEARATEWFGTKKDFAIENVAKQAYKDVFINPDIEGQYWWKGKVIYLTEDDMGKEKKISECVLVNAPDLVAAHNAIVERIGEGVMVPYYVAALSATTLQEVIEYQRKIFDAERNQKTQA